MRVNWITMSPLMRRGDGPLTSDMASVRLRVLTPVRQVKGVEHGVVAVPRGAARWPDQALEADALVISKSFNPLTEALAEQARAAGKRVVFDVCDDHFADPAWGAHYRRLAELAHQVVCNTQGMAEVAAPFVGAGAPAPVVIADPVEGPRRAARFAPEERLKLLWFGYPQNLPGLEATLPDLAKVTAGRPADLTVLTKFVADPAELFAGLRAQAPAGMTLAERPWSFEAQAAALAACDAVLLPVREGAKAQVKSANRFAQTVWEGRAAVAQPMPAYAPFAAWLPVTADLGEGLASLLAAGPEVEGRIAAAQDHVAEAFSPAAVGARWAAVLKG